MRRLILLLFAISASNFCWSQRDFRKGYIINTVNDTLFGLVDYREKIKAYRSCDFKLSEDQDVTTYSPNSIMGYGFENGKFFLSREISSKDQTPQIVFLEVVVKGRVSLYKIENTFFIEKDNAGPQQLINETKETLIDGKRGFKNTNQHIGTINMLVYDCAEIRDRVQEIELDERDLVNLLKDYNRCKGEASVSFRSEKSWTKVAYGVTSGLNISRLEFNNYPGYEHLAGNFDVSTTPMIGGLLDISSPRISERFSLHSEILFLDSFYDNKNSFQFNSFDAESYVIIQLKQFKIPMAIRYTFPKRKYTTYLNAGICTTIHLHAKSQVVLEVGSNTYQDEVPIKNKQLGVWGGLGVFKSMKTGLNAFFEFRYEQTDGIEPFSVGFPRLNSKISNFQLLVGIRFE